MPDDGCEGEAQRALDAGAPPQAQDNLANQLSIDAYKRAEADARVREVTGRWSECMGRRGYHFASIWEPNDREWPDPATDEEIATAKADVACKQEVNLLGTWSAVEAAYHQKLIEERATDLDAVQAHVRAVSANAARVVSAS